MKVITKEMRAFHGMKNRCYNINSTKYHSHGGRGISVCDRWVNSFDNFFQDMGPAPSPNHSLDRIDNSGNYEPTNCRWATAKEQANNTRRNKLITHNGETKTVAQWCELLNMPYGAINQRLAAGYDPVKALTDPLYTNNQIRKSASFNAVSVKIIIDAIDAGFTKSAISNYFKVSKSTIVRISKGLMYKSVLGVV